MPISDPEKRKLYEHGYNKRRPPKSPEQLTKYRATSRSWYAAHAEQERKRKRMKRAMWPRKKVYGYSRQSYKVMRFMVLQLLGDKCTHCGITDPRVLEIDHVYRTEMGKPLTRRKQTGGNDRGFLRRVLGKKIPREELQLLCANCHRIKTYNEPARSPQKL